MRDTGYVPKIKLWRLQGNVYLWHYLARTQGMSGWHFGATEDACKSLIALIDIMLDAPEYAKKQVPITMPSQEVLKWVDLAWQWETAEALALNLMREEARDYWELRLVGRVLFLSVGTSKLLALREALQQVLQGEYDFVIAPTKQQKREEPMLLWFWGYSK